MKITKIFTTETSHRARNAISTKCSNIHGHTYKIELTLEGSPVNPSGMVLDFSYLKEYIKPYIDMFDHCHLFSTLEDGAYKEAIEATTDRWISAPFNWSCEMMSMVIFEACDRILSSLCFEDGERPELIEVTVWETATGRCTCTAKDVNDYFSKYFKFQDISYSKELVEELPNDVVSALFTNCIIRVGASPKQIPSAFNAQS